MRQISYNTHLFRQLALVSAFIIFSLCTKTVTLAQEATIVKSTYCVAIIDGSEPYLTAEFKEWDGS